jgi:hypothetical protein
LFRQHVQPVETRHADSLGLASPGKMAGMSSGDVKPASHTRPWQFTLRSFVVTSLLVGGPLTLLVVGICREISNGNPAVIGSVVLFLHAAALGGPFATGYVIHRWSKRRILDALAAIGIGFLISYVCFFAARTLAYHYLLG